MQSATLSEWGDTMIVVRIELESARGAARNRLLGVMTIANDGTGSKEYGNYKYALSHAGKFIGRKGVFKKGRITGFKRSSSPYRLVQRCLKDAGET